jgi:3-hydroxyisobutyrate dehydrogenase
MAARVARAGIPLTVLGRGPHHDAAVPPGARPAATVAELAAASDVISVCVRDEAQLRHLMHEQGLLAAAGPGTTIAIHSTVAPAACRELYDRAAERGVGVLDAPVSGLPVRARTGDLTIFVGGAYDHLDRARPGLMAMGRTVLSVGPIGSGQIVKILNNLVSLSTVAAIGEALRLADAQGLSGQAVLSALGQASADSFTLRHWSFFEGEWLEPGPAAVAALVAKDLRLATQLAAPPGSPPVAPLGSGEPATMAEAAERAIRRQLNQPMPEPPPTSPRL